MFISDRLTKALIRLFQPGLYKNSNTESTSLNYNNPLQSILLNYSNLKHTETHVKFGGNKDPFLEEMKIDRKLFLAPIFQKKKKKKPAIFRDGPSKKFDPLE